MSDYNASATFSVNRDKSRAPKTSPGHIYTPADIAERNGLKKQIVDGKIEYHGANPSGHGATNDGFILNDDGPGWDRKLNKHFKSHEVAQLFGIKPANYAPCVEYLNGNHSNAPVKSRSAKIATSKTPKVSFDWTRATIYQYGDEDDKPLFQVGRCGNGREKEFRQRRRDEFNKWIHNLQDVRRVLYNLRDVLRAKTVLIVEGEKAADAVNQALKEAGLYGAYVATTAPHGAGKFRVEHAESVKGKDAVFVFPDNDEQGANGADATFRVLENCGIEAHRVELPDLPPKGDAADYLSNGGNIAELISLCENARTWTPKAKRGTFTLLSLGQLAARPAPDFLIDRVLVCGGTSLVTAKHASFKSFVTLDMGLCVASGIDWHGHLTQSGAVVYVAAEGANGLTRRVQAWCNKHGREMPDNFYIVEEPAQIADARILNAFISEISSVEPMLIVLDTLSRCAVGLDENSAKDMGEFVEAIRVLAAQTGAHVLTVHHNNKSGEYRGSSVLAAAVDTHISIERKEGDVLRLIFEKHKDNQEPEPMAFQRRVVELDAQGRETSLVFELDDNSDRDAYSRWLLNATEQKIFDELVEGFGDAGATASQWSIVCESSGISRRSFYRAKTKLVKLKVVSCPQESQKGARYFPSSDWCQTVSEDAKVPTQFGTNNSPERAAESTKTADLGQNNGAKQCQTVPMAPNDTDKTVKVPRCHTPLGVAPFGTDVQNEIADIFDDEPEVN